MTWTIEVLEVAGALIWTFCPMNVNCDKPVFWCKTWTTIVSVWKRNQSSLITPEINELQNWDVKSMHLDSVSVNTEFADLVGASVDGNIEKSSYE